MPDESDATPPPKPYHPKRPHRKSRTGCRNCKARKVKCDESRPACRTCVARNEQCVYLPVPPKRTHHTPPSSSPSSTCSTLSLSPQSPIPHTNHPFGYPLYHSPFPLPPSRDETDMRLLWFYTAHTYTSFSTGRMPNRDVDLVLQISVPQYAFANSFLMDCLLALSAMHIRHLQLTHLAVPPRKELLYRVRAFESYRKAVQAAEPKTYPALLACSLFLCGLGTHVFRPDIEPAPVEGSGPSPDPKPLAVLDWMVLWRGINSIIEVTKSPPCRSSPSPAPSPQPEDLPHLEGLRALSALVFRPSVNLPASATAIPSHLLVMLTSIPPTDPDHGLIPAYHTTLTYLGSLYLELSSSGFSIMLLLRIVTFFTYLPAEFVHAARQLRRPPALIIIAHYLIFLRLRKRRCWWMEGIAEKEIPAICNLLGQEWQELLKLPKKVLELEDDLEIARLLLGDDKWVPPREGEKVLGDWLTRRELVVRIAREGGPRRIEEN
ncbi:putative transcription factor [Thermochaetoides thermophila DSM 1495]|uniref:Putative transcription factor n=1 Tax=Chaetomium thermophilum (strain DSM 1495 / CBS 144.50 / IMI 039719) TaxID=759272 RepID=G0RYD0_CHATD|nr:putative transcription factor [Thermochaetoides thermophila DSM 1495]EGS23916.1 putative transcription factor [Thermochaetoides thermophila DSM 1495]